MKTIIENITITPNSIAIVGWEDSGAGQIDSWLEQSSEYRISCFINPSSITKEVDIEKENRSRDSRLFNYPLKESFKDKPLITSIDWIDILKDIGINKVLITISDNIQRDSLIIKARDSGLELINAIHPTATIMNNTVLHDNLIIHPRAFIGYGSEIYPGALINTNASIDHHNVILSSASIAPGVVTAGNVTIGECAYLWTGSIIVNKVTVGKRSIVGAGSLVLKDIPENCTVVGVPARIIK